MGLKSGPTDCKTDTIFIMWSQSRTLAQSIREVLDKNGEKKQKQI